MNNSGRNICQYLWDRVFIDVLGDVYFCCRKQPTRIGNIYMNHLDVIWNSETTERFRNLSANGLLECVKSCTMLTEEDRKLKQIPDLNLKKIHIEHHQYCNIRCIMCYQKDIKNRKSLDNNILYEHINFEEIEEVQLQGGEPLAYKPCVDLFKELSLNYEVPVTLQTNGILLNDEFIDIIANYSLEIMIALNGATKKIHELVNNGSNFNEVLNNIYILQKRRDDLKSWLRIEGQMTMVEENVHELPDFIIFAEKIGLDSVSFSWVKSIPEFLKTNNDLFEDIKKRLIELKFWDKDIFLKKKHIERLCKLFSINPNKYS